MPDLIVIDYKLYIRAVSTISFISALLIIGDYAPTSAFSLPKQIYSSKNHTYT